jgi:hypothetical protein
MKYIPVCRAQLRKNGKFSSTELHTRGYIQLLVSVGRAYLVSQYKNIKRKVLKCNANIYFSKQRHLIITHTHTQ